MECDHSYGIYDKEEPYLNLTCNIQFMLYIYILKIECKLLYSIYKPLYKMSYVVMIEFFNVQKSYRLYYNLPWNMKMIYVISLTNNYSPLIIKTLQ